MRGFLYSKDLQITQLTNTFNALANADSSRGLRPVRITNWLRQEGYLEFFVEEKTNKKMSTPTKKGRGIGLRYKTKKAPTGEPYRAIIYTKDAQEFLVKNMETILKNEPV